MTSRKPLAANRQYSEVLQSEHSSRSLGQEGERSQSPGRPVLCRAWPTTAAIRPSKELLPQLCWNPLLCVCVFKFLWQMCTVTTNTVPAEPSLPLVRWLRPPSAGASVTLRAPLPFLMALLPSRCFLEAFSPCAAHVLQSGFGFTFLCTNSKCHNQLSCHHQSGVSVQIQRWHQVWFCMFWLVFPEFLL